MNPSAAQASVLVDELVRCGVREVVLCPGSRSAPLAYAVLAAEQAGRVRLHVRVDERTAGFLALGLAKLSGTPAVVITTSGTAVANLHPAVLEAHHAGVPLIVLTADRPAELRRTGANQTTVQPGLYAAAVRWEHDLPAAEGTPGEGTPGEAAARDQAAWRSTVCRAWAAATGVTGGAAGPVHLNVALRDPLVPDDGPAPDSKADRVPGPPVGPDGSGALAGRADGSPWTALPQALRVEDQQSTGPNAPSVLDALLDPATRTVMVLGDLPTPAHSRQALHLARLANWPVVAEPFGDGGRAMVLPHGPLLLEGGTWWHRHLPQRVLVVGRPTLSRALGALLRHSNLVVETVTAAPQWADPGHLSSRVHPWWVVAAGAAGLRSGRLDAQPEAVAHWARQWHRAGQQLSEVAVPLIEGSWPSGPAVALAVHSALTPAEVLVVGSSNPARDLDLAARSAPRGPTVVGNRGLAGIDGMVSTAVGVALGRRSRRTVALMGDLTFIHDSNGLAIGPQEPRPWLTIVVVNDDGGGIFATLEHGEPRRAASFERLFATPTGTDLAALCAAHGVPHARVRTAPELARELTAPVPGIRVLEVAVDRGRHRELRARLRGLVAG